jgi:sulfide:quinone oxidoreductase
MTMKESSVLILGGGFGGLTAANELRKLLGREHKITVVDKESQFVMGLSNLWLLTGRRSLAQVSGDLRDLGSKGITFVQAEVTRIDARARRVDTTAGEIPFDYLIIALGADLSPGSVPGFPEGAYDFYSVDGAVRLAEALKEFNAGKLMILVSSTPYKCPATPYEASMMIYDFLRKKGVTGNVHIEIYTPEPQPIPFAGPEVGAKIRAMLSERGIGFNPGSKPKEVDPQGKTVTFENGTKAAYDLLAGIPTHVVPHVIKDSWLSGPAGWIPVDKNSLQTKISNVFAIGDVAAVNMANGFPIPKVGVLAEEEAKVVARNIVLDIHGGGMREEFGGLGVCFVEVGGGQATMVRGAFLSEPMPRIMLDAPSAGTLELKEQFEAQHLSAWF